MRDEGRSASPALLAELGLTPKLTIYLGGAPGAGKTHRLLTDALGEARAGRRVAVGWIETKGRPQLEAIVTGRLNAMAAMLRGLLTAEGSMAALIMFQRCLPGPPGSTGRVAPISSKTVTAQHARTA